MMQRKQYKRIYNVAFTLIAICSFIFVLQAAKSFITTNVIESQKEEYSWKCQRQRTFPYNQLVKLGRQKEAAEFRRDRQANTLGIMLTDDESGQPFGTRAGALNRKILFYEENLSVISVITTLLLAIVAYFAFWRVASLLVRYVKGQPDQLKSSGQVN
jgi:hypothetical protein